MPNRDHPESFAARLFSCAASDFFYEFDRDIVIHWLGFYVSMPLLHRKREREAASFFSTTLAAYADALPEEEKQSRRARFDVYCAARQFRKDFHVWLKNNLGDVPTEEKRQQYLLNAPGDVISSDSLGPKAQQFAEKLREAEAAEKAFSSWLSQDNLSLVVETVWSEGDQDWQIMRCRLEEKALP